MVWSQVAVKPIPCFLGLQIVGSDLNTSSIPDPDLETFNAWRWVDLVGRAPDKDAATPDAFPNSLQQGSRKRRNIENDTRLQERKLFSGNEVSSRESHKMEGTRMALLIEVDAL